LKDPTLRKGKRNREGTVREEREAEGGMNDYEQRFE
jgi:hypothetical protein